MDAFLEALTAGENQIPPEFDWFAPLLGDWDFTYTDGLGGGRAVQGEWLFRRALNGAGIEDLFICPSRATAADNPAGKWVFCEIGADAFHWQNCTVLEDGAWRVNSDVYARRRGKT